MDQWISLIEVNFLVGLLFEGGSAMVDRDLMRNHGASAMSCVMAGLFVECGLRDRCVVERVCC